MYNRRSAEGGGDMADAADVIVIGGGMGGLSTALLLAGDGHRVRLLERDPAPPPATADEAWTGWERRGVTQFRLLHSFIARWREVVEAELPEVAVAVDAAGGLRRNTVLDAPPALSGGPRPGDERYELLTARRPVVEAVLSRVAAGADGVTVMRGAGVAGLLASPTPHLPDVPHVAGVVTEDGRRLEADLVVDAGGRRSALPRLLADIGATAPEEEREDSGFAYYCRHFRSPDGSTPPMLGPPLQPYGSVSTVTLPTDNGTWGVGIVASGRDAALRTCRDPEVWARVMKNFPLVAHWLEGEPISGIDVMAGIEDRHRSYHRDGRPVATGVAAVGDAWACTNPSVGRGAAMAIVHAVCLRDTLREVPATEPVAFADRWHEATMATVEPLFRDTLTYDRHRLAEIEAVVAGRPYETEDEAWHREEALRRGAACDPELFRAYVGLRMMLDRSVDLWADPDIRSRAAAALAAGPPEPPGPTRAELVAIAAA
jgi:2-polyprenyl-6-methoxyphenol hydroxylase-like FAD-dependent oxidoreductase